MSIRDERREAATEAMADHLVAHGMPGASLRPLAAAAGISDRMLLYYFTDKNEVLSATMARVAMRLSARLDQLIPLAPKRSYDLLLREAWTAMTSSEMRPYLRLWIDLAAGAGRREEPHRTVAGLIAGGFLAWVETRLAESEEPPARASARLLANLEGLLLLESLGRGDIAEAALGDIAAS